MSGSLASQYVCVCLRAMCNVHGVAALLFSDAYFKFNAILQYAEYAVHACRL